MTAFELISEDTTRNVSINKDDKVNSINQTGYDNKYQEGFIRNLYIVYSLDAGLNTAHVMLYANSFTKSIQGQLEEHPRF